MTYRTVKKRTLKNLAAALLGSLLATPALAAELSAYGMFLAADMVVKAVMVGLALASVASWTVLIAKTMELLRTSRALASATQALMRCNTLGKNELPAEPVCAAFLEAARDEIDRSGTRSTAAGLTAKEGIKERIALRFGRIEAAEARAAAKGVSLLASIGALAPFVGLFGTVWGIMNSFIGIAKSQTTNLAVVAPGIAEALLATAIGLVAAIPAVLFYNHLTRKVGGYRALVGDAATAVMLLASRELDSAGSLRVAAE